MNNIEKFPHSVVIGVNDSHEGSVCVFKNKKLLCILEDERFSKSKHQIRIYHSSWLAVEELLKSGTIKPRKIRLKKYQRIRRAGQR
jgi:predicted NodU family carbamoyl transferase